MASKKVADDRAYQQSLNKPAEEEETSDKRITPLLSLSLLPKKEQPKSAEEVLEEKIVKSAPATGIEKPVVPEKKEEKVEENNTDKWWFSVCCEKWVDAIKQLWIHYWTEIAVIKDSSRQLEKSTLHF